MTPISKLIFIFSGLLHTWEQRHKGRCDHFQSQTLLRYLDSQLMMVTVIVTETLVSTTHSLEMFSAVLLTSPLSTPGKSNNHISRQTCYNAAGHIFPLWICWNGAFPGKIQEYWNLMHLHRDVGGILNSVMSSFKVPLLKEKQLRNN